MLFVFLSTVSLVTSSSFTIRVPGPLLLSHRDPARPPFDPMNLHEPASPGTPRQVSLAAGFAATCACLQPEIALAKGGEYGVFEGRIVSLAHPAVMAIMYAASAWSAFTGWQWRRLRELGLKITVLKEDVKQPKAQIEAASSADMPPPTSAVQTVADLQSQIDELTAERKVLANGGFRDKHYQVGSVVLGLGTSFAIEGPVNTFLRAQKLFPGPHLYAGAGIVVCWAMAASLVPLMAKGSDAARSAHIAFNVLALGLFTWQLPTGWEIMLKVIKFTKFP
uniref:DUF4079 domain-containing protein n=1 Tax=Haptolina ericina TaxID=156174 RepID=A0A7S3ADX2_9EUKA|mmetsp:Transcript_13782/g.31188  ORF Transcript_13782/g.31188 Transcript_13782/m.31188 type:complete len:279 (+) Transcript_13782:27-863(+)